MRRTIVQITRLLSLTVGLTLWLKVPWLVLFAGLPCLVWLATTRTGRQALAITATGLSTIGDRIGATSVVVVGIAGVVGVMVSLLAMASGFEATLHQAGSRDSVIFLRAGANAELSSSIDRDTAKLAEQLPGILRNAQDIPVASPEVVVVANLPKKSTGTDANVEVRGVGPEVWQLRDNVHMIAGRRFRPGLREMVVGKGALSQFAGLEPGSSVNLNNQRWKVVGVFDSGDAHNSEIWADNQSVASAYRRSSYQSVTARLAFPGALATLKSALAADPRLKLDVETTLDYYNKQSERLTSMIRALGTGIAIIMAVGAVFGALNTMYAAVAARAREIATLRALGFTGLPVIVSVLLEAMTLALAGGLLGAGVAYIAFNGYTVSTLGSNFSQVVFKFRVSPQLLATGLQWALAIGFIGGLFPALRAANLPLTRAFREL